MTSPLFSPVQPRTLADQVAEQLHDAIVRGLLRPGQRIVEAEIASQMGISRAPVREAIRQLQQRGLIVSRPHKGTFVGELTLDEIDDVYGLRQCLEVYAVGQAVERATDGELLGLSDYVDRMRSVAREGAPAPMVEIDLLLHRRFCELSRNRKLVAVFDSIASEVRMVIALVGRVYTDPMRLVEDHAILVEAVQARDRPRAEREVQAHLLDAWQKVRALFLEFSRGAADAAHGRPRDAPERG